VEFITFATSVAGFLTLSMNAGLRRLARVARRAERISAMRRVSEHGGGYHDNPETRTHSLLKLCAAIGVAILRSGLLSQKTLFELSQSTSMMKMSGSNSLAVFIGAKSLFFACGIVGGWILFQRTTHGTLWHVLLPLVIPVVCLLVPDIMVRKVRNNYLMQVEAGIADALDMLVICAEAGLPIEAAIGRVAREMEKVNRHVANEFRITSEEMLVFADHREVLMNFGRRTGLASVKRIASALNQTILAGSSVSQALRVLSTEMRADALTRYEARAAQLPVLLTLPMILFILPVVFIIAAGPAALKLGSVFSHP